MEFQWGHKKFRSSRRIPTVRKALLMRSFVEFMEKKEMKIGSAISKVKFVGWKMHSIDWEQWVRKLSDVHRSTWKNAGIYEAVMSSIYAIKRYDELIFELASRWCSQSNTFVFPWGKASLTLEDMHVLGGFSDLGVSTLTSLENDGELFEIKERLEVERIEIQRIRGQTRLTNWMKRFKGSESDLEHAAFLSMWLSRFVFPKGSSNTHSVINNRVFPIAAQLSKGIKIALAQPVLAMLYKELTFLTKRRLCFTQLVDHRSVHLYAPFHLVQIWAWERFRMLKPVPNIMYCSENFPRLARWSNVKSMKSKDLRSILDSSEKAFMWRPYDAFGTHEDLKSFARRIKSSKLIGFDSCVERYQPERVSRQFGSNEDTDQNMKSKCEIELPSLVDESYTNERSKGSGFDLEARISRLEDIVYEHIKALEKPRMQKKTLVDTFVV